MEWLIHSSAEVEKLDQLSACDRGFAIRQSMSVNALAIIAPGAAQIIEHALALTGR